MVIHLNQIENQDKWNWFCVIRRRKKLFCLMTMISGYVKQVRLLNCVCIASSFHFICALYSSFWRLLLYVALFPFTALFCVNMQLKSCWSSICCIRVEYKEERKNNWNDINKKKCSFGHIGEALYGKEIVDRRILIACEFL